MLNQIIIIVKEVGNSFLHVWPYLLITIPLAVSVNLFGGARYINKVLKARPITAIFLATLVGAFSPFCSCGVIPIMSALLIGGFPLAPVMTFCIASPSMDVEAFFLSVTALGWELAIWRMAATLILSVSAGLFTHLAVQRGWLGEHILRVRKIASAPGRRWNMAGNLRRGWQKVSAILSVQNIAAAQMTPATQTACCGTVEAAAAPLAQSTAQTCGSGCKPPQPQAAQTSCGCGCDASPSSFSRKLAKETLKATGMVLQFMLLAFVLKAFITLYVPSDWIVQFLGAENPYAILAAAFIGIPVYTSNLTALPMMGGLLTQGMNPGAALAFLIAGPTTTLPAMAAVWGITTRRVFALYVAISLIGALLTGYLYYIAANL